ncbi:MAG: M23 family metallopeptidase [Pseudomonadota bacterium]
MNVIIYRRGKIRPLSFRLPLYLTIPVGLLLTVGLLGNLFWLQGGMVRVQHIPPENAEELQLLLTEQRSEIDAMRKRMNSESQTVGKRLASLQARFMRVEALGQRLTEATGLIDGEFSFGEPAAVGGPALEEDEFDFEIGFDYASELDDLANRLSSHEIELNVLEGLVSNRKFNDELQPRSRPITWGWLSSPFGKRVDPITGKPAWHNGVDFAGDKGSSVVAVAGGVVTFAGERSGYGLMVEVNHGDGYVTRYAHHEKVLVKKGDVVKKGGRLALMGSTGRSTGPHVHFEVLKNGRHQNPTAFLGRSS